LRAAQKLGVPVVAAKLSPEELITMADEGNFGHATEHVIWQFLSTKGIHVFPSDRMMQKLEEKAIKPTTTKVKLEEIEYVLLHCPLYEVVSAELSLVADEHMTGCDIIVGGDHREGAFQFPAKLVYKFDNHPPVEVKKWIGKSHM